MDKNKGFTIIELIVVIIILAILATLVVANLTQFTAKSKKTAIKANMSQLTTAAQGWIYEQGSIYVDETSHFCAGTEVNKIKSAVAKDGAPIQQCNDNPGQCQNNGWAFATVYPNNEGLYCVDSSGKKFEDTNGGSYAWAILTGIFSTCTCP